MRTALPCLPLPPSQASLCTVPVSPLGSNSPMDLVPVSTSLSSNWAYQSRIPLTVGCILTGLALFLLSKPNIREDQLADFWLDVAGCVALGAGVLIRLWATRSIAGRKAREVVSEGPYSLCRNPLYWGTLLIAVGACLFLKSWTFAVISLGPILLYPLAVVPAEERYLRNKLGQPYLDYCNRVPRWWPRLSGYQPSPTTAASSAAARAEAIRSVWWVLIPVLCNALCWLRDQPGLLKVWPLS